MGMRVTPVEDTFPTPLAGKHVEMSVQAADETIEIVGKRGKAGRYVDVRTA
jgi:hypothetical protein